MMLMTVGVIVMFCLTCSFVYRCICTLMVPPFFFFSLSVRLFIDHLFQIQPVFSGHSKLREVECKYLVVVFVFNLWLGVYSTACYWTMSE